MPLPSPQPLCNFPLVSGCVVLLAGAAPCSARAAEPEAVGSCATTVDVAALARALESRKPAGVAGWEIGVRGSDCILTITDAGGVWQSGIRADREPMLVAAEVSWAWLHRERSVRAARVAGETAALDTATRVNDQAAKASVEPVQPAAPMVAPRGVSVQKGRLGIGATALNGRPVSTISAGYSLPVGDGFDAGAEGWCSLAGVGSQFLYVDSAAGTSARADVRVASVGGFIGSSTRLAGLDLGVRSGVALVWAHAALESAIAKVSETAWLPEASVHGRLGFRIGQAEPALEIGYRAVVGDDRVVGPSTWAFAGPSASLSLGWRVE